MQLRESIRRRPDLTIGLALAVLGALIYLPYLGAFPLWDPWEPHYSQVAWEMKNHRTWLDPYYRDINNWWSKPILMLWILRASFELLWDSNRAFATHELYARLPFAILAIAGGVAHFDWVRRLYGRAVGALSAVVLITGAQYLLIGRQVMVDMVMVFAYSNAMGYLAVGLLSEDTPDSRKRRASATFRDFVRHDWPYVAFWSLQAFAILAKGFVPPVLALLALASFALVTLPPDATPHQRVSYWVKRGAIALGLLTLVGVVLLVFLQRVAHTKEQRELTIGLVTAATALLIVLGCFGDWAPSRHARQLLARMHASWGVPLCLAIAAPWYVFMTLRHGWHYWYTFIFFHHLGRAAGEINLPAGTFDFYLRNLGFALYPWTGFFIAGLVPFIAHCHPHRSAPERRNLYVLCLIAAPLAFFMLSGTKFAHYVFPLIPASAVVVAASLVWLMRGNHGAASGKPASCGPADDHRGTLAVVSLLSTLVFVVLLGDVRHDVRHLLRLFVYYFNRATPFDYQPAAAFTLLGLPVIAVTVALAFSRFVARWHLAVLGASAALFACYLGWVTMPAMGATYSYRPAYDAYRACANDGEPIGQYNNWPQPERSVMFLFQNRAQHLNSDAAAIVFLSQKGRKFVIVDKPRLADLRRVARQLNLPLHVVFDDHPYVRLVSTEPTCRTTPTKPAHVLGELPAKVTPIDANFDGKVRLHGWRVSRETVHPGEAVALTLYFEALAPIEHDLKILVHADNAAFPGHRVIADHFPAQGALPTRGWQEGRIIEDEFTLHVPLDYPFESFFVWAGLYAGSDRLPLSNNPANDGANRVRGPLIFVNREPH